MTSKLSVVILTKDEEVNIRACLESVKWADEIIVVDDLSRDFTVNICREYTDKIYFKKLENFGEQRRFSVEKAGGEWVLFIDADERVTPELKDEILKQISCTDCDYFLIWYKTFYLGKPIRFCGWHVAVEKLFRRGKLEFTLRKVHENRVLKGKGGYLRSPLLHYSYRSIQQHIDKINLYSRFEAEQLYNEGLRLSGLKKLIYLFVKPIIYFFHRYISLGGIFDGREGFLISYFTGLGYFFIYAKVWELQRAKIDERK